MADRPPDPMPDAGGESRAVQPLTYVSILGLFALISLAVVFLSWPGYQTARHTREAELALAEGRWADAVPHLTAITARYPGAWMRQRQLGDALLEQGRATEALEAYQQSLKFQGDASLAAPMGRALYLIDPGDARGPRLMEEALRGNPNDPRAHFYIAMYQKDQGRYREAALHYLGATADARWFERSKPHIRDIRERLLGG